MLKVAAKTMLQSRSILYVGGLALTALLLPGCGEPPPPAGRVVQVPTGGEPVLTAVEMANAARQPDSGAVVRASFEHPADRQPVEPPQIKPFDEWTEQEAAADALGRIGPAAVPSLMETLRDPDPKVRLKAIEVLARMGGDAKDAVPELIRLLEDPDEPVRKAAIRTLGRIGPPAKEAVPALMQTLMTPVAEAGER
jgi:HEAT repeat protein